MLMMLPLVLRRWGSACWQATKTLTRLSSSSSRKSSAREVVDRAVRRVPAGVVDQAVEAAEARDSVPSTRARTSSSFETSQRTKMRRAAAGA